MSEARDKQSAYTLILADDVTPFGLKRGRMAAFLAGVRFAEEEMWIDDTLPLSRLVDSAIGARAIVADPRLTLDIETDVDDDGARWKARIWNKGLYSTPPILPPVGVELRAHLFVELLQTHLGSLRGGDGNKPVVGPGAECDLLIGGPDSAQGNRADPLRLLTSGHAEVTQDVTESPAGGSY